MAWTPLVRRRVAAIATAFAGLALGGAIALFPGSAQADHIGEATYVWTGDGGEVRFTVAADGSQVDNLSWTDVPTICGPLTGSSNDLAISELHGFAHTQNSGSDRLSIQGGFAGPGTAAVEFGYRQFVLILNTEITVCGPTILTVTLTAVPRHTLTVAVGGSGAGTVTGPGITCPGDCSATYDEGAAVALEAHPTDGSTFAGWSEDCTGTGDCGLTMDGDRVVSARFDPPDGTTPRSEFTRTLSLAYSKKKDKFKGKLASQSPACISGQKVKFFEKKKGKDPKLGSDTTGANGTYSLKEKNAEGRFYAEVRQTSVSGGTCLAAKSKTIKVG